MKAEGFTGGRWEKGGLWGEDGGKGHCEEKMGHLESAGKRWMAGRICEAGMRGEAEGRESMRRK